MQAWEERLCSRATDRVVRPFEWGLEWARNWPCTRLHPRDGHSDEAWLRVLNEAAIERSDDFYGYRTPGDFALAGHVLKFTSAVETAYAENNTVYGQWFPAKASPMEPKPGKKAVIVLPHWNSHAEQHVALCTGHQPARHFGAAAEPSVSRLPHAGGAETRGLRGFLKRCAHDRRDAAGGNRRAVAALDWLEQQGYEKHRHRRHQPGLVLCVSGQRRTTTRLKVNVFNHCSTQFADVVWEGISSQHIRQSMEGALDLDRLREVWVAISPAHYIERFADMRKRPLLIYGKYDTTFLPRFSQEVVDGFRELDLDHAVAALPCGHYTMGETPFKFMDGYHICAFLKREM